MDEQADTPLYDFSKDIEFNPEDNIVCPYCKKKLRGALGPGVPEAGGINFCDNCGNASVFETPTKLRIFNQEEANDPELNAILAPVRASFRRVVMTARPKKHTDK